MRRVKNDELDIYDDDFFERQSQCRYFLSIHEPRTCDWLYLCERSKNQTGLETTLEDLPVCLVFSGTTTTV